MLKLWYSVIFYIFFIYLQDLGTYFIHFEQLFRNKIKLVSDNSPLNNFSVSKISSESENFLKFISFSSRSIAAFYLDKSIPNLSIKKTWSFFSEKIKIIFEDNEIVYFLNSDNYLCVTNSKNQSQVQIVSEIEYNQAVMISKARSSESWYVFATSNGDFLLVEVGISKVYNIWKIPDWNDVDIVSIRGSYVFFKSKNTSAVASICENNKSPVSIETIDSSFLTIDYLKDIGRENRLSITFLGYSTESLEDGCIFTVSELFKSTVLTSYSVKESSLALSETEFGRYMCLSSK